MKTNLLKVLFAVMLIAVLGGCNLVNQNDGTDQGNLEMELIQEQNEETVNDENIETVTDDSTEETTNAENEENTQNSENNDNVAVFNDYNTANESAENQKNQYKEVINTQTEKTEEDADILVSTVYNDVNTGDDNENIVVPASYTDINTISDDNQIDWQDEFADTPEENDDNATEGLVSLPQLEEMNDGDLIANINTNMGVIKVRLFSEYAPKAVENFVTHSQNGYYDGLIFHRVVDDFVIQGGDPEGTGTGGESIWEEPFEDEVSYDLRHFRGALSMANSGPDTNGSQFFIVQNTDVGEDVKEDLEVIREEYADEVIELPNDGTEVTYGELFPEEVIDEYINNGGCPSLDMSYSVFGHVYEGLDVVDNIADVETDDYFKPLEAVIIENIEIGVYEIEADEIEISEIEINETEIDETETSETEINEIEIDEAEVNEIEIEEAEIYQI